jgi:tRNA dimethylallyltransferase
MFIDALIDGLDEVPVNSSIRKELTGLFNQYGLEPLLTELIERDPVFYEQVDRNNPMRIIRALEAIRSSGQKMSDFQKNQKKERDFQVFRLSIDWPREILYYRINRRVDDMISQGLIHEVLSLADLGVNAAEVGGAGAWSLVNDFNEKAARSAGVKVTDEGAGGTALSEFLAEKRLA